MQMVGASLGLSRLFSLAAEQSDCRKTFMWNLYSVDAEITQL
jgi:hypothetical protein